MGLGPTECSSMLHRRHTVHLVSRFYHTLESHKERCWRSDPHLTMTFYLCWYSVLFILKGAVISMMCFKGLLNIVSYSAPFWGGGAQIDRALKQISGQRATVVTGDRLDFIHFIVTGTISSPLSALPIWGDADINTPSLSNVALWFSFSTYPTLFFFFLNTQRKVIFFSWWLFLRSSW